MAAFAELGLDPGLVSAVEDQGWLLPTAIQAESIPLILGGGDVMAAAETGSGKTAAFALPILQIVHEVLAARQAGHFIEADSSSAAGCKLNIEDRDPVIALADEGLRCQTRDAAKWGGVRATAGFLSGRVYYEAEVVDEGLCRVGWSVRTASLDLGTQPDSYGYGGTGKKSTNRNFEDYGGAYGQNDVIGCLLDLDGREISFTKNGAQLGTAFRLPADMGGRPLHPAVCMRNAELLLNFGSRPFKHPPQGAVGAANASARLKQAKQGSGSAKDSKARADTPRNPTAIILEPSKDLAEQTAAVVAQLQSRLASPSMRSMCCLGGENVKHQVRELEAGVDIVIGTPGRIIDLVEKGKLVTDQVKFFVLDEADRLLETGSTQIILKLFSLFPKASSGTTRLQVLMFSATLHSDEVIAASNRICQNPILVDLKGRESIPETVDHVLISVDPREDRSWLQVTPRVPTDNAHLHDATGPNVNTKENWSQGLKRLKPRILQRIIDQHRIEQALIFCRTNFDCDNLEAFLKGLGGRGRAGKGQEDAYSCKVLAGQRSMDERREALQAFKDGDIRFLICTDVAARGIDISALPYIINMTLPDRSEDYIHRVGRVGRAGKLGLAISLVSCVEEKVWYVREKGYKPWYKPSVQDTKTHDQCGHTIWYNEMQLLQEVEERLKQKVTSVAEDLSLPPALQRRLDSGGQSSKAYGDQRSSKSKQEILAHQELLRPAVLVLAELERQAQATFFDVQRFAALKAEK